MNIVFVHFGSRLPKHLRRNLTRAAELFETHEIFLISDFEHVNIPPSINKFFVSDQAYFHEAEKDLLHPVDFRNNFWFLTLKRFLVFNLFMREHPAPMVHLESDVVISQDFPFDVFSGLTTPFAFPLISDTQGIPSILFLRDKSAADQLCDLTLQTIKGNPNTTDMLILAKIRSEIPEQITILPSGPSDKEIYVPNTSNEFISMQFKGLQRFGGFFDGAAIGQYLLGDDPRNNRGIRNIYFESGYSALRAKDINYEYSTNRKFLNVTTGYETIPIFAIHVHSKDIRVFREQGFVKVIKTRIRDNHGGLKKEFLVYVALRQFILAFKRRVKRLRSGYKYG